MSEGNDYNIDMVSISQNKITTDLPEYKVLKQQVQDGKRLYQQAAHEQQDYKQTSNAEADGYAVTDAYGNEVWVDKT